MYLNRVVIENIRSITELTWQLSEGKTHAGWHVILGDNGSGKTAFLRAIALALVGPDEAAALRQDWNEWLTRGQSSGSISLDLNYDDKFDKFSKKGRLQQPPLLLTIKFTRQDETVKLTSSTTNRAPLTRSIWGGKGGWFSAAYGPFRRFTGGDMNYEKLFYAQPRLAAHLSVFGEDVALTESLNWLQKLLVRKLEGQTEGNLLDAIQQFINQPDFLPHNVRLEKISSQGAEFVDGNGCQLWVENLSDGYRSILSMTFELIRQLANVYGEDKIFDRENKHIAVPGVVLIDEIDAHLHPSWQKQVGIWFLQYFPNIQFIVTTHSPLICRAAENGSVLSLPLPGSGDTARMVTGDELNRLIYGNVLEAYGTELFGQNVTRSDTARVRLRRLAELNQKELHASLTAKEMEEQQRLRATFPISAGMTQVQGETK
jgi:hypothetical protein